MKNVSGLLRIKLMRGVMLAVRDMRSSDPYVILRMGHQKVRTRVVKGNVNPEWNEELTLVASDPNHPIKLQVYDHDTFTRDDKMGEAEIEIEEFMEAVKLDMENVPSGTVIAKVTPNRQNCLCEESCIIWENGKVTQPMFVRLKNVECGEIELKLQWIDVSATIVH